MNKSIIVYGNDFETACSKLDNILESIDKSNVSVIHKSKNHYNILLKNGDRYASLYPCDRVRGYRWQYAYIDREINKEFLETIIFSTFCPYWNVLTKSTPDIKDHYEYY